MGSYAGVDDSGCIQNRWTELKRISVTLATWILDNKTSNSIILDRKPFCGSFPNRREFRIMIMTHPDLIMSPFTICLQLVNWMTHIFTLIFNMSARILEPLITLRFSFCFFGEISHDGFPLNSPSTTWKEASKVLRTGFVSPYLTFMVIIMMWKSCYILLYFHFSHLYTWGKRVIYSATSISTLHVEWPRQVNRETHRVSF